MPLAPEQLCKMYELIGEDCAALVDIINSFLEETPALVDKLCRAVQSHDLEVAGMAAHGLKSTSHDMGAIAFSSMCREVEVNCRTHSTLPSTPELQELIDESSKVIAALQQTLQAIRNGTWAYGS
jgi:HPt (histidine-containing phosphotransfer) domain-containing protein